MFLDLTGVQASKPKSKLLPDGEYQAYIDSAELRTTKDGLGQYIKTTWKIATGDFTNRLVFQNYNIKSKNEKAESIGKADLKAILEANGKTDFKLKSPSDLLGLKATVYVKTRKQEGFEDANVISSYKTSTLSTITHHGKSSTSSTGAVPGL